MSEPWIILPPTSPALLRRRVVIVILFSLLGLLYATVTPIFEISDEVSHYPVIDYIADHGRLPVQNDARLYEWDWEAAQPPLYYALAALIVAPFNRDELESHLIDNPHGKVGIGLATDNHNFVLHDWEAEAFPWRGTALHVRLVRMFSLLLGAGAVWMVFAVVRLALPDHPAAALAALCLTAFNPMFIAISGSVNNDTLVNFLAPAAFAVMLTMWRFGFAWRRVAALGLLCTLASAAKLSGTILFIPAGLVITLVVWRERLPFRRLIFSAAIMAILWGGLFGWWYLRNLRLYDDPLANNHMAETVGLREETITVWELFREEQFSFFAAYWGWFGALNILAPMRLFYLAYGLVGAAAIGLLPPILVNRGRKKDWLPLRQQSGGWGVRSMPQGDAIPLLLLTLALLLGIYSLITWTLKTPASQGRLLFPFMAAINTWMALGLVRLLKRRRAVVAATLLLPYAFYCGWILIPHAFRLPTELAALPAEAQAVDVQYDTIQLLGYKIDNAPIEADNLLEVTLYWRPTQQTAVPLSFYIQVFAPDREGNPIEIGKLDSYPGRGLLRSDTWQTDVIYADSYRLELKDTDRVTFPFEPRLKVGWRDHATDDEIPAQTTGGEPIDSVMLRGGRVIASSVEMDNQPLAEFGSLIRLYQADVTHRTDGFALDVVWEAAQPITEDFIVFVQLVNPQNPTQPLAFGDSAPRWDWWRTSLWVAHNRFRDRYFVPLPSDFPAGEYHLLLGFYRPSDFTRLAVNVPPYPDAVGIPVEIQ